MAVMLSSITWKLIELKKYQQIALFSKENQLLRGKEKSSHWVFGIKEFTRFFSLLKSCYPIATLRCLFWTSHLPKSVGLLNRLISRTFKQLSYLEPSPNSQWWSLLYFLLHLKPLPRILPHREENKRHFSSNRALSLRHRTTRLLRWSLRRRSLSLCGDARQQWRISALDGFSGQIDGQRCVLLRVRDPWFPALSLFLTPSLLSDRQRRFAEHKTRCKRELGAFCERAGCELPGLSHRAFGTSRQTRRAPLDRAGSPNGRGIFDLLLGSRGSSRRFPSLSEW